MSGTSLLTGTKTTIKEIGACRVARAVFFVACMVLVVFLFEKIMLHATLATKMPCPDLFGDVWIILEGTSTNLEV